MGGLLPISMPFPRFGHNATTGLSRWKSQPSCRNANRHRLHSPIQVGCALLPDASHPRPLHLVDHAAEHMFYAHANGPSHVRYFRTRQVLRNTTAPVRSQ